MADDAPKKQVVDVEFRASGLGKLKAGWADFAGDLLEPIAILAAGGTKVQAAWAGIKGVFLSKVLGPIGMAVGAATGFLLVTRKLIGEWKTFGIQSAKAIETLTLQFKPLLGSLDLAKKRAREVFAFSVKSPFQFGELAEGNKILEGLTRGALSNAKGMTLVGDAAAVAGTGFAETARQVGRLYDGLMSGRPVGEAAFRLQELGLISGQTRTQIEAMQAANAAGSAVWAVAQKDLERTKGAMQALSDSVEGLESTYEDTRKQLEAGFGKGFMEGEKAGIKSATQVMAAMVPTAEYLGEQIGSVSNFFAELKAKVTSAVTALPGFSTAVTGAMVAMGGLAATVLAAAGALTAKFLLGVISAAYGNKQLAASAAGSAAAAAAQTAAVNTLAGAQARLALATQAMTAKQYVAAAGHLRVAAAETVAAVKTNALAASQVILRGALGLTAKTLVFVTRQVIAMTVAMVASPAFWLAAALTAAAAAALHFYNETKKAREELAALANESRATVAALKQQALAIRSVADLRKAEADAVGKLAEAYAGLAAAQEEGNGQKMEIAKRNLREIAAVLEQIRGMSGKTELDAADVEREDARKAAGKDAERAADDDRAAGGERSALDVARERKEKGDRLRAMEEAAMAEEKRIAAEQEQGRRALEDRSAQEGALLAKRDKLVSGIEGRRDAPAGTIAGQERAMMEVELAGIEEKIAGIRTLRQEEKDRISEMALGGKSELAALQEKLSLYAEMRSAQVALVDAQKEAAEVGQDETKTAEERAAAAARALEARQREKAAQASVASAGMGDFSDRDRQNAERRVEELKAEREKNLDPAAAGERARALRDAEAALAQGRLDTERGIADLRMKGYERESALLDIAQKKLEVEKAAGRIDEDAYNRQKSLIAEQRTALERETALKREELEGALRIAQARREEAAAREKGNQEEAEAARRRAEALEDERATQDARREAEALPEGERAGYVQRRQEEERAAREQARKREETEKKLGRDRAKANQGAAVAEIEARVAGMTKSAKAARKIREDAARAQDEVLRKERERDYRDQGFGAKEANDMANRDVKTAQAERMMQEMMGRSGNVVASSLAKIGGGGNVSGNDPMLDLQKRAVALLEEIRNYSKENIDPLQ